MRLADRVAIVTGGAKGIGRHYVRALSAEGASDVIAVIYEPAAEAAPPASWDLMRGQTLHVDGGSVLT